MAYEPVKFRITVVKPYCHTAPINNVNEMDLNDDDKENKDDKKIESTNDGENLNENADNN